ncbi:MAG: acetyltransferase [Candidatus Sericytochromatia bacterium]
MKNTLVIVLSLLLFSCSNTDNISQSVNINNNVKSFNDIESNKRSFSVIRTVESKYWDKIELIRANDSNINPEKIHHKGRQRDPDIVKAFGTDTPSSTDFCLHDAGEPTELKYKTPILLIHGANTTATRSWADPEGDGKKTGLMQYLKAKGFRVFAITFANKHGDSFIWSSHVGRAIERIKEITKSEKVDTLGHSKGGFTLRLFVSNIYKDSNPFKKDVRKAIFVAAPHRGIDYSFRHPIINWGLYEDDDNPVKYAPMSWESMLWKGAWVDSSEMSLSGEYFPGQLQMIGKFDKIHPLSTAEQDWYTTYYGGTGFVSKSKGIDYFIQKGGNIIDKMKKSPVDPSVQFANLVGNMPNLPGILNEMTGASDGVVFVSSTKASEDMTGLGAKLLEEKVLPLNHLDLVSNPKSMEWIATQFSK